MSRGTNESLFRLRMGFMKKKKVVLKGGVTYARRTHDERGDGFHRKKATTEGTSSNPSLNVLPKRKITAVGKIFKAHDERQFLSDFVLVFSSWSTQRSGYTPRLPPTLILECCGFRFECHSIDQQRQRERENKRKTKKRIAQAGSFTWEYKTALIW